MMILGLYLRHRMIGPSSRKGSAGIFGLTATILSPHFDYCNNHFRIITIDQNASWETSSNFFALFTLCICNKEDLGPIFNHTLARIEPYNVSEIL